MVRWITIAVVLVAAVSLLGGSAVLASVRELPQRAVEVVKGEGGAGQSAAQVSPAEFLALRRGQPKERVRELLGEPETTSSASVEGVDLDCWVYGVSGSSGAFQICFANGRLSSRFRYG